MSSHTLYSDEYVTATLEPDASLVRYARSATPYPTVDELRVHHRDLANALATLDAEKLVLLIDVRAAPPRNDEAFESEITRAVGSLLGRFKAYAFLVKTAVGGLQVRRLSASGGVAPNVVFSEDARARAFLASHLAGPR